MREIYNYFIHEKSSWFAYAEVDDKILNLDGLPMIYFYIDTDKKEAVGINIEDFLIKIKGEVDRLLSEYKNSK